MEQYVEKHFQNWTAFVDMWMNYTKEFDRLRVVFVTKTMEEEIILIDIWRHTIQKHRARE